MDKGGVQRTANPPGAPKNPPPPHPQKELMEEKTITSG